MSKKELMKEIKIEGSKEEEERQMKWTKKCRIYKLMIKTVSKVQAVRNTDRIPVTDLECVQRLYWQLSAIFRIWGCYPYTVVSKFRQGKVPVNIFTQTAETDFEAAHYTCLVYVSHVSDRSMFVYWWEIVKTQLTGQWEKQKKIWKPQPGFDSRTSRKLRTSYGFYLLYWLISGLHNFLDWLEKAPVLGLGFSSS
jgi:hypothetical protein